MARRRAGRAAACCSALGLRARRRGGRRAVAAGRGGAGRCCRCCRLRRADRCCSCAPTCRSRWSPRTATVAKPWIYKFAGAWGNHEGSMLLWVTVMALAGGLSRCSSGGCPSGRCSRRSARRRRRRSASTPSCCSPRTRSSGSTRRRSRAGAQSAAAGPRPRLPSADALPRLCRPVGRVQLRGRRAADARGRPGVARAMRPWVLARVDPPDARHHRRQLLGLLRARLGRLVVLGPGRERLADAVARGDRAAPFGQRAGRARRACAPGR